MRLRSRLRCEFQYIDFVKVWIGILIFLFSGILSLWIGGNPRSLLLHLTIPGYAIGVLWLGFFGAIQFSLSGAVFGILYSHGEAHRKPLAYKGAIQVITMHLFTIFSYPLFFVVLAWNLSLIAVLIALLFCLSAIIVALRVHILSAIALVAHFLWLLYMIFLYGGIIFMN